MARLWVRGGVLEDVRIALSRVGLCVAGPVLVGWMFVVPMLAGWTVCAGQAPVERRTPPPVPGRAAGEPGGPTATLKVQTRLVTLAVNAVDAHGAPVSGLNQADFRLLEDGAEQKLAFFEKESNTPLSIVLSIDGSGSLRRNERLEKIAAKKFVNTLLRPQDEMDLQEFADSVKELVPFTNSKQQIEDGLGGLTQGGATAMYDGIFLASQSLAGTRQEGGRRRVLVLITDGGDTVHGVQYDAAVEAAQRAGVMIYALIVIPIYADAGRNTGGEHALIQMTQDTGGKYFYIEDAKDLGPAFAQVSEDLRTQYVLGYYAPSRSARNRSEGFRAITVELTGKAAADGTKLRYRSGYYANSAKQ